MGALTLRQPSAFLHKTRSSHAARRKIDRRRPDLIATRERPSRVQRVSPAELGLRELTSFRTISSTRHQGGRRGGSAPSSRRGSNAAAIGSTDARGRRIEDHHHRAAHSVRRARSTTASACRRRHGGHYIEDDESGSVPGETTRRTASLNISETSPHSSSINASAGCFFRDRFFTSSFRPPIYSKPASNGDGTMARPARVGSRRDPNGPQEEVIAAKRACCCCAPCRKEDAETARRSQ